MWCFFSVVFAKWKSKKRKVLVNMNKLLPCTQWVVVALNYFRTTIQFTAKSAKYQAFQTSSTPNIQLFIQWFHARLTNRLLSTKNDWKLLLSCFLLFLKRNLYRLHEECETKLFGFGSKTFMEWSVAHTRWEHQIYVTVSCTEFNWKFLWWKLFNQNFSVEEWRLLC